MNANNNTTNKVDREELPNGNIKLTGNDISLPSRFNAMTDENRMKYFGISPKEYEISSIRTSEWDSASEGGLRKMRSLRITCKPREKATADILAEITTKLANKTRKPVKTFTPKTVGAENTLVVTIADVHVGLLCTKDEVGESYNINTAKVRTLGLVDQILKDNAGKTFKKVIVATLGDVLHVNDSNMATKKGTKQDTDGRFYEMAMAATDMMIEVIRRLSVLGPVHYLYVPGNHDYDSGFQVANTVKYVFESNPDVTCQVTQNIQKAMVIDRCLVGFSHGEERGANAALWLVTDYRKQLANADEVYVFTGHLHHNHVKEANGVTCYGVTSVCGSSTYETSHGYSHNYAGINAFEFTPKGMRA
ncbi:MAG: metallophosphoesterase family protein, partial [Lachnospiraceae bacterium]|nr:metallophosphoesterase family protein [Lachnospiraceae bacterium]